MAVSERQYSKTLRKDQECSPRLSSGAGAEVSDESTDERFESLAQNNKEIADQIGDLKAKMAAKAMPKKKSGASEFPSSDTGEIAFNDEAPFKDELPF